MSKISHNGSLIYVGRNRLTPKGEAEIYQQLSEVSKRRFIMIYILISVSIVLMFTLVGVAYWARKYFYTEKLLRNCQRDLRKIEKITYNEELSDREKIKDILFEFNNIPF